MEPQGRPQQKEPVLLPSLLEEAIRSEKLSQEAKERTDKELKLLQEDI